MTTNEENDFYITERKIQKLHKVYQVKDMATNLNKSTLPQTEKDKL